MSFDPDDASDPYPLRPGPSIRLSGDPVAMVKDTVIAELQAQVRAGQEEIDRLTHLHRLDHSLADQHEERRASAERTTEAYRGELVRTQQELETAFRQRDEYLTELQEMRVRLHHHQAMETRALQRGDRMLAVVEWARQTCHKWRLGGATLVGYDLIERGERVLYELDNPQPPEEMD